MLGACLTSAASGVYYEFLVKASAQKSILVRNLQLGMGKRRKSLLSELILFQSIFLPQVSFRSLSPSWL